MSAEDEENWIRAARDHHARRAHRTPLHLASSTHYTGRPVSYVRLRRVGTAAVRRRIVGLAVTPLYPTFRFGTRVVTPLLSETGQARFARIAHYHTLRSDPEGAMRPKVEEVRAELAALERESIDR